MWRTICCGAAHTRFIGTGWIRKFSFLVKCTIRFVALVRRFASRAFAVFPASCRVAAPGSNDAPRPSTAQLYCLPIAQEAAHRSDVHQSEGVDEAHLSVSS